MINRLLLEEMNIYQEIMGKPDILPTEAIPFDENLAYLTADYFDKALHDPQNPEVQKSYASLKKDIAKQWEYATKTLGYRFIPSTGDPYPNSEALQEDVRTTHRLYFYTGGNLPANHPLSEIDPNTGFSYNDMFRAVHDLFGHAGHGNQFGPVGERRAFLDHAQMMSASSIPALAFETHAQNSWFNFGKHLRTCNGRVCLKGEVGYVSPRDRPYAEQKANVLPASLSHVSAIYRALNTAKESS